MVHDPKRFGRVPRATVYILAAFLIIELGFTVNKRMPSLASFSRPRNLTLVVYAYHETDEGQDSLPHLTRLMTLP